MHPESALPWFDRDVSWVAFNGRVLQEAADARVPLLERVKFLAIYSSNLDEFFRVRVARLRREMAKGVPGAEARHAAIIARVDRQQNRLGELFRDEILPGLRRAIIQEPDLEDLHWALVEAAAAQEDDHAMAEGLRALGRLGYDLREVISVEFYDRFRRSGPGRKLMAELP